MFRQMPTKMAAVRVWKHLQEWNITQPWLPNVEAYVVYASKVLDVLIKCIFKMTTRDFMNPDKWTTNSGIQEFY